MMAGAPGTGAVTVTRKVALRRGGLRVLGGPAYGFGRMWEKTYTMSLGAGVAPRDVMAAWQQSHPELWPRQHACGVSVLYADDDSFTVTMAPGEPLAGWITLSADRVGALTSVRVNALIRAHDPLCELALALGGYRRHDEFWVTTMTALGLRLGVRYPMVVTRGVCLDARHQWRHTRNVARSPVLRGMARATMVPAVLRLGLLGVRSMR